MNEIVLKKVWERSYSAVPGGSGPLPATGKGKNGIASFWNVQMSTQDFKCTRHVTGIIMFNYGPARVRRVVRLSQRSVNQKAREHSQRSKTGEVCGKRRREVCGVRHTRRAVQWWQNMEFCAPLHTNRHFVFAVFHLSSFPACSRSQCLCEWTWK